ncbi:hypothetical protein ERJ75_000842300 [Trypanosoma vivax]|nr:hypothetical protein ERJ75_000842300 [Trypanosoma vivax]
MGHEPLACSYRAECVEMERGWRRLAGAVELGKTHRTGVVTFTSTLSPLVALNTGPAGVRDAMLRHTWDVILRIVRLRVSVNIQFVFSHFGVPGTEAADKAAEQGHAHSKSHPAWTTDVATGVERTVRDEMCRGFE